MINFRKSILRTISTYSTFGIILIIFLLTLGCGSINNRAQNIFPAEFTEIHRISVDFTPAKCCFSASDKTLYVMDAKQNKIHFFRDGKKINSIGGMGFGKQNFTRLSDIALSPDDKLLALDSFEKIFKKFDKDGNLITEFAVENLSRPKLFDISIDENFYIYDENRNEILSTKFFSESDDYFFGKFELSKPTEITLIKDELLISDLENTTLIYDTFGQMISEEKGNIQRDNYQDFVLQKYYIEHINSGKKFTISPNPWLNFNIKNSYVILYSRNEIVVGEFVYESR
jgi:hypothetical protein